MNDNTRQALLAVADRLASGMPTKSAWSALHGESYKRGTNVRETFEAVRTACGVSYMEYLGNVLRKRFNEPKAMEQMLRLAAEGKVSA